MAFPPVIPPATRTDATVMATNHPADHNLISSALTEILNHITTMEQALYPIGSTIQWPADLAPGNHELCRGQEVSKTTYPEVYALIGSKFGAGTATTFTMPDLRGRYAIGFNTRPGDTYFSAGVGEFFGLKDSSLPAHTHGDAHEHGVNIFASFTDIDHTHGVPLPSSAGFIASGVGASAGVGAGTGYAFAPFTSYATQWNNPPNHRHAVNGSTDSGPTVTTSTGVTPTNTNLPPSVSFNFIMRMH